MVFKTKVSKFVKSYSESQISDSESGWSDTVVAILWDAGISNDCGLLSELSSTVGFGGALRSLTFGVAITVLCVSRSTVSSFFGGISLDGLLVLLNVFPFSRGFVFSLAWNWNLDARA